MPFVSLPCASMVPICMLLDVCMRSLLMSQVCVHKNIWAEKMTMFNFHTLD